MRTSPADPYGLDPQIVFESESSVVYILHFIRVYFDVLLSPLSKSFQGKFVSFEGIKSTA